MTRPESDDELVSAGLAFRLRKLVKLIGPCNNIHALFGEAAEPDLILRYLPYKKYTIHITTQKK
jgi:hypothetical protein